MGEDVLPAHLLIDPIEQSISCPSIINRNHINFLLFGFRTTGDKFRGWTPKKHGVMTHREPIAKIGIYLCCQTC